MKIKYQLITTVVSFTIVLIVVSSSIFYTNYRVGQLLDQQNTMANIQRDVGHLSHISNDYFLLQTDSQLLSWQSTITAISGNLTDLKMKDRQQDQNIFVFGLDIQSVDYAFRETVSYLQIAPRNQSVRILPEFQIVWSSLTDKIETLSNDSNQLSQLLLRQVNEAQQANLALIVILLSVFAVYLLVNFILIYRNALKPISELQTGMNVVGSGNLDYIAKIEKKNEVGDLSNSFNQMTANLKDITLKLQEQEHLVAIGKLARMVGHDIRNPLQAIAGDLYLIDNDAASLPEDETKKSLQESVRDVQDNLFYIAKIVEDLQDYAKPQRPNMQRIEIENLIGEVMQLVSVSPNLRVVIDIEKDFPEIVGDFSMMKRALTNLANNAVQAMSNGGQLTLRAHHRDTQVIITVEDTGEGIPEEVKTKLFEPMFTTKAKGQGLGLAVVKRLVEAQGGTVGFESEEGKGTKFIIKLPLR